KDVLDGYKELYNAEIMGDWEVASKFLEKNPEAITKVIAIDSRTLLHVAVIQGNLKCIKAIVERMPPEILEYKTGNDGCTALHYAAMNGHAKAAEIMVNKNPKLTQIVDRANCIQFYRALTSVVAGQRETATYLYSVTRHEHPSPFSGGQGDRIILHMIDAGFYNIASSLVQRFPELVIGQTKKVQIDPMIFMAKKPFAFVSGAKLTFWQRCIYSLVKVDINTTCQLDTRTNERNSARSSEENLRQSTTTNERKSPRSSEENLVQSTLTNEIKPPCSSEENLQQSVEGTNTDEENPLEVGRHKRSYLLPGENLENTEGDDTKISKWDYILVPVGIICILIFLMIKFAKYVLIKFSYFILISLVLFFFVFPERFILKPVTELHKQIYNVKVKHTQAKALVKSIFTPLKQRMNKQEVADFFDGSNNVMKMATRHGNNPMGGQFMIHMAIAERSETILNLICKASGKYKTAEVSKYDCKGNTILHYAAKLVSSAQLNLVSGACLQMQREMQWFKCFNFFVISFRSGVENMISENNRLKKNADGDSAHDIFTKEHKEFKEKGEKWLKETSGSCMVVAPLITTVAFTSAFTVPGGYISSDNNTSKNGIPVFLEENSFMVFAVADSLDLFSSITSVLMFLAIHTSRYAEADFLKSLPNNILVAFSASLFIVLGERFTWARIPIVVFSCFPVTLFSWLQLPLFFEMIPSTYWGSLFGEHTYISSLQPTAKNKED
ncbi:hypothetical protein MKW98_020615, partial [Papaver atlanticum]